jgi:ABC-2 type transport system ATP-binding protein
VRSVISVAGVRKTYGKTVAVDDVSFDVHDGEIFGLIGPNGAGKTTTMECVEGDQETRSRHDCRARTRPVP